jgi:C-terminal processing protease CtpA/Prc
MVARLQDGHGFVTHPAYEATRGFLPITLDWIENQLVVIASDDDRVQVGDVVTEMAGRPALEVVEQAETWLPGSPQFRRLSATRSVTRGPDGEHTTLTVQRGGDHHSVALEFSKDRKPPRPPARQNFEQLSDGVYYVSLIGTAPDEIRPRLEELIQAKAVIFDLRGYPNGTHFLLQHMTDKSLQSQQWLVPRRIYPDQERLVDYGRDGRWDMPPLTPRFAGKVIFLTNAQAISYAESFLSIVAQYRLADIVGQPTAGANGNVNPFQLPDGTYVSWTGMRVINHDGSQHHVRGVQPTVLVEPTLAAVREGRDEYIETALRLIGDGS